MDFSHGNVQNYVTEKFHHMFYSWNPIQLRDALANAATLILWMLILRKDA